MRLSRGYPLEAFLQRQNNNLDLVRLVCSIMVIFGHSYLILPVGSQAPVAWDIFTFFRYPGVYSASVAVKIFFFVSGLLVTESLVRKGSAAGFLASRFLRIWPALLLLLVVTTYAAGPLLTTWDTTNYLRSPATLRYVLHNLTLNTADSLPGVFTDHHARGQVNGSLWTLRYELAAYAWLLVLFSVGALRHRWICLLILAFSCIDPLLPNPLLPTSQTGNPQIAYLPPCFILGACLALWKKHIILRWEYVALAACAVAFLRHSIFGPHLFLLLIFLTTLQLAAMPVLRRLQPGADLSYGTYLWGFFVQQTVARYFADGGFLVNFFGSLLITLSLAWVSWHLVEKRAIKLARSWTANPTISQDKIRP